MATNKSVREQVGVDLPEPEPLEVEAVEEAEPEVETPERPAWLPDKYKDEEAFVAAYHGLEEELRQRGEAQNEMQAQLDQLSNLIDQQQQMQMQRGQPDQAAFAEQLMNAYEQDPIGTMVYLAQQAADQRFQQFQAQQQPQTQQAQQMAGELMANSAERILEARYP